jgi:chromosome segregation ATPase
MEGMSQVREDMKVVNDQISTHKADQIGFEEAVALVKEHQGSILIRTKSGSCMVRLADGSVIGVNPPLGKPDSTNNPREKCETKLRQEIDKLNKAILINKNTLDKAHHHLRDKEIEIRQLKTKLEDKEKEAYIQNKMITVRGKVIEDLKAEIRILKTKLAETSADALNIIKKTDEGKRRKDLFDYGLNKIVGAVGMENEPQPCGGTYRTDD